MMDNVNLIAQYAGNDRTLVSPWFLKQPIYITAIFATDRISHATVNVAKYSSALSGFLMIQ